MTQKIITLYIVLRDEPGVLSGVIAALHKHGANVLTLNQSIPVDGAAPVTLTVRLDNSDIEASEYGKMLSELEGTVEVRLLSSE